MRRGVWLALLFGAVGLFLTVRLLGGNLASLGRLPAWAFVVGAVLVALGYLAAAARLRLLTVRGGHPLGLSACLRAHAVGQFSAAVTPASAGQLPAVALALARDGVPSATAWSVGVYVWVLDLAFIAYSVPLSLLFLGRSAAQLSRAELWAFAVATAVLSAFLMWVLTYRLRWLIRAGRALFRLRWLARWRASTSRFLDRVEAASEAVMRGPLGERLLLHALTAVLHVSALATFWVMLAAVRPGTPLLTTLAVANLPSVMAAFVPTPGGAGLLEVLTASLFLAGPGERPVTGLGRSAGAAVAAAILGWRLLTFYSRFVVGPIAGATFARPATSSIEEVG